MADARLPAALARLKGDEAAIVHDANIAPCGGEGSGIRRTGGRGCTSEPCAAPDLVLFQASTPASIEPVKPEQRAALAIGPGLLRLSVGLEDVEDLAEDLARGSE